MFKGTSDVLQEFRKAGYRLDLAYLRWLIQSREMMRPERGPGGCFFWTEHDVARLKSILSRRHRGPVEGDR